MLVFLDTEFTDFAKHDLISLALVAEDGCEFYAERTDYRHEDCSDFVCQEVLPLLGHVPGAACTQPELTERLRTWFECLLEPATLVFDFEGDWLLLADAWLGESLRQAPPNVGGDVYMGENAATSFFEVRQNITGKSLYVGLVEVKNVLDLTNPVTLQVMNIDPKNLTALVNAQTPSDASKAYQYTNQIANQAFDAGYTGILYPSSRNTTGTVVVLFDGRYDPNIIKPILNTPITTPPQKP